MYVEFFSRVSKVLESMDHILETENEETSLIHNCAINQEKGASKDKYIIEELIEEKLPQPYSFTYS